MTDQLQQSQIQAPVASSSIDMEWLSPSNTDIALQQLDAINAKLAIATSYSDTIGDTIRRIVSRLNNDEKDIILNHYPSNSPLGKLLATKRSSLYLLAAIYSEKVHCFRQCMPRSEVTLINNMYQRSMYVLRDKDYLTAITVLSSLQKHKMLLDIIEKFTSSQDINGLLPKFNFFYESLSDEEKASLQNNPGDAETQLLARYNQSMIN